MGQGSSAMTVEQDVAKLVSYCETPAKALIHRVIGIDKNRGSESLTRKGHATRALPAQRDIADCDRQRFNYRLKVGVQSLPVPICLVQNV